MAERSIKNANSGIVKTESTEVEFACADELDEIVNCDYPRQ